MIRDLPGLPLQNSADRIPEIPQEIEIIPLHEWLKKEGVEAPPIEVHFSYGEHGAKEDAKRFKRHLQRSDIVLFEMPGWDSEFISLLSDVQTGKERPEILIDESSPDDRGEHEFFAEMLRMVAGRDIITHPLDLPGDHKNHEKYDRIYEEWLNTGEIFSRRPAFSLEQCKKEFFAREQRFAKAMISRDNYTASIFRTILRDELKRRPEFLKRDRLRVLVIYGSAHEGLQQRIGRTHPDVHITSSMDSQFNDASYVHNSLFRLTQGVSLSGELRDRGFFEYFAGGFFPEIFKKLRAIDGGDAIAAFARQVVDLFTIPEWEQIYLRSAVQGDVVGARRDVINRMKSARIPADADSKKLKSYYADLLKRKKNPAS